MKVIVEPMCALPEGRHDQCRISGPDVLAFFSANAESPPAQAISLAFL